jgi:N utilization substance protein A
LSPAKISSIQIDHENKKANVFLKPEDIAMAIGRNGVNIKLATKLTGYTVDIYRDDVDEQNEEDIVLEEFADEIDLWIIEALKAIGCDTAKSVLRLSKEELVERADLEEETVDHVLEVLNAEFEEETEEEGEK